MNHSTLFFSNFCRNVICQPSLDIPDFMYAAIDCEMVGVGLKGKHSVLGGSVYVF